VALTISPPSAVLVGCQTPRLHSVPAYVSTAGDEAIELAAQAGLYLDPWQQLVLRDALGEDADGKWAAFEVGLVVPRQSGKGSILEALELAGLFLFGDDGPPPLILHSAHEFKTSAEHFRRMRDLIEGSDNLRSKVRIVRTAAGSESIELHSGARLRFVTRTGGSGRGFSADTIIIDEAYNLNAESLAAVMPTMSSRPNPQIWYTSSAGMSSSDQLRRVRDRGIEGGGRLAYFEWSVPDGADPADRAMWAMANPALGRRIPESFIAAEFDALPVEQFARERLGVWYDATAALPAFDVNAWLNLADPSTPQPSAPVFAVACAPDQSWSAIAAAWRRPDGHAHVILSDYNPGVGWVAGRTAELRARYGSKVVFTTSARGLLANADEPSQADQARAHNALVAAVESSAVRHGNEPALNMAVRSARWRAMGDTRVLDRKGSADISPIDAAAVALYSLAAKARPGNFFSF
jgi:hypothetical protein